VQTETEAVGTSGRLPDTASPLPLVGLVGLMSLGGALLIRAFRRSAV
jgi:LPXTG-motif cell wall-anchored protein